MESFTIKSPWNFQERPKPGITAPEFLLETAQEYVKSGFGDFNWITDTISGEKYNYKDYDRYTKAVASALYKKGLRTGDVVIYLNSSIVHQPIFHAGVWRANGAVRSSYFEDTEETFMFRIRESKVRIIVCEHDQLESVVEVKNKAGWPIEVIVVNGHVEGYTSMAELFQDDGSACPKKEVTEDSPAAILCTSGTTGKSKGAVYTHKSLVNLIWQMKYFKAVDKSLFGLKSTHASGFIFPSIFFLQKMQLLVMQTINMENILKSVDNFKAKAVLAFPSYLLGLVNNPENLKKYDLSSIELCYSGGVSINSAIENNMRQLPNFKHFIIMYGLTELIPITTGADNGLKESVKVEGTPPESVGKIYPNVQVRILSIENEKWVNPGSVGEICSKGDACFSYYLNQPEETKNTFVDGEWLKTGDLGYVDSNGFLFVVDRIKEVFKCAGNHVSPAEIDGIILSHPAVGEVCTVGVPDTEGDDLMPRAWVSLKKDVSATAEEIKNFANSKLAKYKHIRGGLYIIDELPRGLTGKVTRNIIAKLPVPK